MQQPDGQHCGPSFQLWRTLPQQEAARTHTQRLQDGIVHCRAMIQDFWNCKTALESNLTIWKSESLGDFKWKRTSGERCASRILPIRLSLWPTVFALLRDSMVFLILRLWRIGTSDMNSTPPATTASHWPAAIRPTAGEKEGWERDKGQPTQLIWKFKKIRNFYKNDIHPVFIFLVFYHSVLCTCALLSWHVWSLSPAVILHHYFHFIVIRHLYSCFMIPHLQHAHLSRLKCILITYKQ